MHGASFSKYLFKGDVAQSAMNWINSCRPNMLAVKNRLPYGANSKIARPCLRDKGDVFSSLFIKYVTPSQIFDRFPWMKLITVHRKSARNLKLLISF